MNRHTGTIIAKQNNLKSRRGNTAEIRHFPNYEEFRGINANSDESKKFRRNSVPTEFRGQSCELQILAHWGWGKPSLSEEEREV
jgi:hypothetical protein